MHNPISIEINIGISFCQKRDPTPPGPVNVIIPVSRIAKLNGLQPGHVGQSTDPMNTENGIVNYALFFDTTVIPVGATLTAGVIHLLSKSCALENNITFPISTQEWIQASTSWSEYNEELPWRTPGGDYEDSIASGIIPSPCNNTSVQFPVNTLLIEDWINVPSLNKGVFLLGTGAGDISADFSSPSTLPRLEITYTTP